jgi:hypothetical protein
VSAVANAHHKRIHNRTYGSAGGSGGSLDNVTGFNCGTGKSFSEAFILASTNPQYDKILFIELRELVLGSIHVVYLHKLF